MERKWTSTHKRNIYQMHQVGLPEAECPWVGQRDTLRMVLLSTEQLAFLTKGWGLGKISTEGNISISLLITAGNQPLSLPSSRLKCSHKKLKIPVLQTPLCRSCVQLNMDSRRETDEAEPTTLRPEPSRRVFLSPFNGLGDPGLVPHLSQCESTILPAADSNPWWSANHSYLWIP